MVKIEMKIYEDTQPHFSARCESGVLDLRMLKDPEIKQKFFTCMCKDWMETCEAFFKQSPVLQEAFTTMQ